MPALEHYGLHLTSDDKHLLQYAAQLKEMTLADFIREAAVREAKEVVEGNKVVSLTAQESKALLEALDRPFAPNAKLQEAMRLAERIISASRKSKFDPFDFRSPSIRLHSRRLAPDISPVTRKSAFGVIHDFIFEKVCV